MYIDNRTHKEMQIWDSNVVNFLDKQICICKSHVDQLYNDIDLIFRQYINKYKGISL